MGKKNRDGGLVFSTDSGRMCPDCRQPLDQCQCTSEPEVPAGDGIVRLQRETKGRKGKGVTLITGIPLAGKALKDYAKKLKARCGTGGTVRDGIVEIQGDHRDFLLPILEKEGWTVRKSGG